GDRIQRCACGESGVHHLPSPGFGMHAWFVVRQLCCRPRRSERLALLRPSRPDRRNHLHHPRAVLCVLETDCWRGDNPRRHPRRETMKKKKKRPTQPNTSNTASTDAYSVLVYTTSTPVDSGSSTTPTGE